MSTDREEIINKVIKIASGILCQEGTEALTVRRIARESGASTQLIYTLFGGKFGLLDGLYKEGFRQFREFMAAKLDSSDDKKNVERWVIGYREFALRYRPFFSVMFARPSAEYAPPRESLEAARASFQLLIDTIQKVQPQGFLTGDATLVALKLWSRIHGIVALEEIGHVSNTTVEQLCEELLGDLWTEKRSLTA